MEERRAKVFVAVPSYNHARYIGRCLHSIFSQTRPPDKLLVIDDGSTDGSVEVIAAALRECPFDSELIVRENRGLCATLNEAYGLSSGEYFAYLGADDLWLPGFIEARVEMLERRPTAVLGYGHSYFIDENDRVFDSSDNASSGVGSFPDGDARELLANAWAPISSTVFYRRASLEGVRWNEASRLEDYEMYLQLMGRGEFAFDPQILSVWRYHTNNTSRDVEMMVGEITSAQERRRAELGLDDEGLRRLQQRTRFRYSRVMLQHGDKRGAMSMGLKSWRGAASAGELLKWLARLALPMKAVELKRRMARTSDVRPWDEGKTPERSVQG